MELLRRLNDSIPGWVKIAATLISLASGAAMRVMHYEREITLLKVENAWLRYQIAGGQGPAPDLSGVKHDE